MAKEDIYDPEDMEAETNIPPESRKPAATEKADPLVAETEELRGRLAALSIETVRQKGVKALILDILHALDARPNPCRTMQLTASAHNLMDELQADCEGRLEEYLAEEKRRLEEIERRARERENLRREAERQRYDAVREEMLDELFFGGMKK